MTDPREVTVSDEEISAIYKFCDELDAREDAPAPREIFRQALAAFLAARVPDTKPNSGISLHVGFNACRDKVLKGL